MTAQQPLWADDVTRVAVCARGLNGACVVQGHDAAAVRDEGRATEARGDAMRVLAKVSRIEGRGVVCHGAACTGKGTPARYEVLLLESDHYYCRDCLPRKYRPLVGLGTAVP